MYNMEHWNLCKSFLGERGRQNNDRDETKRHDGKNLLSIWSFSYL
jgi:hypothetical protein